MDATAGCKYSTNGPPASEGENLEQVDFSYADLQVQVHDLSLRYASKGLAKNLGNIMGFFLDYDGHLGCFANMNTNVDSIDNEYLLAPFTIDEFCKVVFSMHLDKVLRPDDMNPTFHQHYWSIMDDDIFMQCCAWIEQGELLISLNDTLITLILKKDMPTRV
ncbi:hypothetical protein Gorai_014734 [Gossypium raimondii]|uniref:Uncharacterized protein n=1 Tax=Gossypium raimondii TaxID=29730 RepID=A0A7J8P3V1_GOSRA|nr:hypothetical protein [Gossypium raimondii]